MNEKNNNHSSEDFLRKLKANDSSAFEELYKDYYPMVKKFTLSNSGNTDDANDLFQETIIKLIKGINKKEFKLESKLGTYIYSIARLTWLYRLRTKKKVNLVSIDDTENVNIQLSENYEISDSYEEKHRVISDIFKEISESCRQLLSKYYFKQQPLKDIAVELNISYGSIKVKKTRCMKDFKEKIKTHPSYSNLNE